MFLTGRFTLRNFGVAQGIVIQTQIKRRDAIRLVSMPHVLARLPEPGPSTEGCATIID